MLCLFKLITYHFGTIRTIIFFKCYSPFALYRICLEVPGILVPDKNKCKYSKVNRIQFISLLVYWNEALNCSGYSSNNNVLEEDGSTTKTVSFLSVKG